MSKDRQRGAGGDGPKASEKASARASREARLKAALRANLQRRKAQGRARRDPAAGNSD